MDPGQQRILEMHAEICRALSHPTRLQVLHLLKDEELSAGELARRADVSVTNLSQHLAIMRQAGLLASRREGSNVYYSLAAPQVLEACSVVQKVLAGLLRRQSELLQQPAPGQLL